MGSNKKYTPLKATLWSFIERLSTQIVSFCIGIILARLLSPHDYGVVGMIAIFIALSNVFIDSGFANALIHKQDRNETDLSTAFYFNVAVGGIVYSVLWLCAPFIADYFNEAILVDIVRISGLTIIFYSLSIVQTAVLTANLNIRLQTIINLCSQVPAGVIAIYFAMSGFGVYSLALQTVIAAGLRCLFLFLIAKWRPKEKFDLASFKYLWNYGSKLLAASLIGTTFDQIYSVLIGRYVGTAELGYYSKGANLKDNVAGITNGIIQKVALPVLSTYQNDTKLLCRKFRDMMKSLLMFIAPLSAFLFFSAKDIVVLLWTDKWLYSSELFSLLIVGAMFTPIGYTSLALLQAVGKTSTILKLEFPKKTIYIVLIALGFCYGVKGLCVAQIFICITAAIINMFPTKKILGYSYIEQALDLVKYMVFAFFAYFMSSIVPSFNILIFCILEKLLIGTIIYVGLLWGFHDKLFLSYMKKLFCK